MNAEEPPGGEFWFGTDAQGRDIYSRVLLRRPHLAHGRHRLAAHQHRHRRLPRALGRLLGRLVGRFRQRPDEPGAGDPVADLRARHHGDPDAGADEPPDRARAHQLVLHLPARARIGAVAEEPGLRAGREGSRIRRHPDHADAAPAQHARPDHRHRHARHGRRGPGRSGAVVPRSRHPAAFPELGQHAVRCSRPDHHRALDLDLPGAGDLHHRARAEPARRRPARSSSIRREGQGRRERRAAAPGRRPADRPRARGRALRRRAGRLVQHRARRDLRPRRRVRAAARASRRSP